MVGFATFDSEVHFYSLRPNQAQPQMLVVPDVEEPYCPPPGSLLAPLHSSRPLIDALLEQIPQMFAGTRILDGSGTAAIEAAVLALKVSATKPAVPTPPAIDTMPVTCLSVVMHTIFYCLFPGLPSTAACHSLLLFDLPICTAAWLAWWNHCWVIACLWKSGKWQTEHCSKWQQAGKAVIVICAGR